MTGRTPLGAALHVQVSRLVLGCLTAAVAATGALIVTVAVGLPTPPPGPAGLPGPPPRLEGLAVVSIVTGFFVLAWLSTLVAFCRDQILARLRERAGESTADPDEMRRQVEALADRLRAELASDRERDLRELGDRITALTTEYGEQRETEGYLNGMRVATSNQAPDQRVRPIRRTAPPA